MERKRIGALKKGVVGSCRGKEEDRCSEQKIGELGGR